jgi:5-methylcytosine-specific restriction endonuclease McrA
MDHNFKHRSKTRVQGVARRREIYERDAGTCYICKKPLNLADVHLDHLIPVAKNGNSDANNLAVSCGFCNRSRGTRIGLEQLAKLDELRT